MIRSFKGFTQAVFLLLFLCLGEGLHAQCENSYTVNNVVVPNVHYCIGDDFIDIRVFSSAPDIQLVVIPNTSAGGLNPYSNPDTIQLGEFANPLGTSVTIPIVSQNLLSGSYNIFAVPFPVGTDDVDCEFARNSSLIRIYDKVDFTTSNGTVCAGGRVNLEDYVSGTVATNEVKFYYTNSDAANAVNDISTLTDYPTADITYYVAVKESESINIPEDCVVIESFSIDVLDAPPADAGSDVTICESDATTLTASGGVSYEWLPDLYLSSNTVASPTVTTSSSMTYAVTVTDVNGCTASDVVDVTVTQTPVCLPITSNQ